MSDSDNDAFQSADDGDAGSPSVACSSPVPSASPKQCQQPKPCTQGRKKDRKRGKRGKKGTKLSLASETSETSETVGVPQPEKDYQLSENLEDADSKIKCLPIDEDSMEPCKMKVEQSSKESDNSDSTVVNEIKGAEISTSLARDTVIQEEAVIPHQSRSDAEMLESNRSGTQKVEEPKLDSPREAGKAFERLTQDTPSGGGWGWGGGWGNSILSTATSSVSSFTNSIGEGIKTAVETVESSLGVPDPEELARIQHERREERKAERAAERQQHDEVPTQDIERDSKENEEQNEHRESIEESNKNSGSWLSGWGVSQLSTVVHKTANVVNKVGDSSRTLVTGSLDVLETIGKKTYEVVAEGEHGVNQLGRGEKTNLSSLLREAVEEAEKKAKQEEQFVEARKSHFGAQFDDNQGVVQLEALEMLSNECEAQVHNLLTGMPSSSLSQAKTLVIAIKEAFSIEDIDDEAEGDQDFTGLMKETAGELGLNITVDRLIAVKAKAIDWLSEDGMEGKSSAATIHQEAIQVLARLTAAAVGHFHRVGQLCLSDKDSPASSYKTRAVSLANTTKYLGIEVGILSGKFTNCLSAYATDKEDTEAVNPLMTNIYLEATNSTSYIQDAFQLLLPVLQQAALRTQK